MARVGRQNFSLFPGNSDRPRCAYNTSCVVADAVLVTDLVRKFQDGHRAAGARCHPLELHVYPPAEITECVASQHRGGSLTAGEWAASGR